MYLSSSFKTFHLFHKLPNFKYLIINSACMPMHRLTYVQKGYVVTHFVIIWNQLDEQDKLSLMYLCGG